MNQSKIDRINFLARKSKKEPLSAEELAEQKALREEYINSVKNNLIGQLNNTYIVNPDGTKTKLKKKKSEN